MISAACSATSANARPDQCPQSGSFVATSSRTLLSTITPRQTLRRACRFCPRRHSDQRPWFGLRLRVEPKGNRGFRGRYGRRSGRHLDRRLKRSPGRVLSKGRSLGLRGLPPIRKYYDVLTAGCPATFRQIAEDSLHAVRRFLVRSLEQVPVQVHGQLDRCVSKAFGDLFGVNAFGDQKRRVGVPQIVEAHFRYAGMLEDQVKTMQDVRCVDGRAETRGEDQLLLLPGRVGKPPLLSLFQLVLAQGFYSNWRNVECPAAARGLRVAQLEPRRRIVFGAAPLGAMQGGG